MKVLKSFLGILAFWGILLGVGVGECFAQAAHTGGDFRAGVRIPIINIAGASVGGDVASIEMPDETWVGVGLSLSIGYRWTYFGLYLDQDIEGVWPTGDAKDYYDGDGRFYGGTYFMLRGLIPIIDKHLIDIGWGMGAVYSDKKGIMGDGKDGHVGFGMKADISYTYFINELVGVGLNIDYTLGLNVSVDGAKAVHEVTPTIHTRLMF